MTVVQYLVNDQDPHLYGGVDSHGWPHGLSWLHWFIYRQGWPDYTCEDCTGTGLGCYCQYHGASAPNEGPRIRHLLARWLWKRVRKDRNVVFDERHPQRFSRRLVALTKGLTQ